MLFDSQPTPSAKSVQPVQLEAQLAHKDMAGICMTLAAELSLEHTRETKELALDGAWMLIARIATSSLSVHD
jgi:hypothetical protein